MKEIKMVCQQKQSHSNTCRDTQTHTHKSLLGRLLLEVHTCGCTLFPGERGCAHTQPILLLLITLGLALPAAKLISLFQPYS